MPSGVTLTKAWSPSSRWKCSAISLGRVVLSDVNYFFHGDNYKCRSERYLSEAILLGNRGLIVSVRYFPGFLGSVA